MVNGEPSAPAIYSARGFSYLSRDICIHRGGLGHCVLSRRKDYIHLPASVGERKLFFNDIFSGLCEFGFCFDA
jgi:hypothetical protein